MTKVSVIGSGMAGMIFTYALLRSGKGYDVTVYTDRTPDEILNNHPPTGTAALYGQTIDIERELGMDFWTDQMHCMDGVLMDFKPTIDGDLRIPVIGRFDREDGGAVDVRLRVHRWMNDLEAVGGRYVVETVTPARLDEIASQSDLTVLAAGKGDVGRLIPRDASLSVYDKPQRYLLMSIVQGVEPEAWDDERIDFRTPVKFNFYGDTGEYFWVPYTHKTAGKCWCVLFEAKTGGKMDIFRDCQTAEDTIVQTKKFIKEHAPWEWDIVKNMRPIEDDPYSWLKGAFPPTVREAYGELPSGNLVMPIGDTAITFDPIGGQGGNCTSRNAKYAADAVIERGDGPFDAAWMQSVKDSFWEFHGRAAYTFNNILLEPLDEAGRLAIMTASTSREFAEKNFVGNMPKPNDFFPWIQDLEKGREKTAPYMASAAE